MSPDLKQAAQRARDEYRGAEVSGASDEVRDRLMTAWREAVHAAETIDERCLRLGIAAMDKDAEAERHMAAAADAAGRAAGRRARFGTDALCLSFDREELACTKLAAECMAEAERLRSQANALRRAQGFAAVIAAE